MRDPDPSLPFDLRSLEIFLAVCESGSMSKAARALGLTQPAVSLAIGDLERKLGFELYDRTVRPLAVTLAGSVLRQRASGLLADAREIGPLLRETRRGKLQMIRVGIVDSLTRTLSVPMASYLATKAGEVAILSGLTSFHAGELLTRRLDVFLGVDDLEDWAGLERWPLIKEPYVLLMAAGKKPPRTLPGLKKLAAAEPLIRFSSRSQTGREIETHLRRLGIEPPKSYEFDGPSAVSSMVAAGAGFAITTPLCVREAALPSRQLVVAPLPGPHMSRTLTLVARHRELGPIPRELGDVARRILRDANLGRLSG